MALLWFGIRFVFNESGLESFVSGIYSWTAVKSISIDSDWVKKMEWERKNLGEQIFTMSDKKPVVAETNINSEVIAPIMTATGSNVDMGGNTIKLKASSFLNDHYSLIRSWKFSEAYRNYTDSFKSTKPILKDLSTFSSWWFWVTNLQLSDIHEVAWEDLVFEYTVVLSMQNGATQKNLTRARLKQDWDIIKIDWYDSKSVN